VGKEAKKTWKKNVAAGEVISCKERGKHVSYLYRKSCLSSTYIGEIFKRRTSIRYFSIFQKSICGNCIIVVSSFIVSSLPNSAYR